MIIGTEEETGVDGTAESDAPISVVHLDHTISRSGAEYALARMLGAQPDWQPTVFLPPSDDEGAFDALPAEVPIRMAGLPQRAGISHGGAGRLLSAGSSLLLQARATRRHAAFDHADIIDANTSRAAAYGALAVRRRPQAFVVHLRDIVSVEALGGMGYRLMTRLVLPRADGVIANSAYTLASARAFLRTDALAAVIPSASGLRCSPPHVPVEDRPLRIGMLARVDPWKGQSLLLRAFARAFPTGDEQLEIAGGAPFGHQAHLEELRSDAGRFGVGDRVHFLGHVSDVDTLLSRWDVGVQASLRAEPMGQNVLQYLAAGMVTVVADEGGPTEWVVDGENGLRFRPRDAESLATTLRRLADDPDLRAGLATRAVETPGLLTDAEVAQKHAAFYRTLLARR